MQPVYRRILLKLSGEALGGGTCGGSCIDQGFLAALCRKIAHMTEMGVQVALVCGGGNIWRGRTVPSMQRTRADQAGMLATVINGLALQDELVRQGVEAELFTAFEMGPVARRYTRADALAVLERGGVAILSAGTGHPYFTTDSASALRGIEIEADVMLKGTRVDGVYTADPEKDPAAVKFDEISFEEVLDRRLKVMDLTAFTLCRENGLQIIVFDMDTPGNLGKVLAGERIGTLVKK